MPAHPFSLYLASSTAAEDSAPAATSTAAPTSPPVPPQKASGFDPSFFVIILVFVLAFMFLIQRPEKRRQEERLKALEGLKKGDKVVSSGGIHGVISSANKAKSTVMVKVAQGVEIEFSRSVLTLAVDEEKKDGDQKAEAVIEKSKA